MNLGARDIGAALRTGRNDVYLVAALDAGQLPLDQLLAQYQRGAELLRFCRTRLDAVEQQIRVFENGDAQPWNAP